MSPEALERRKYRMIEKLKTGTNHPNYATPAVLKRKFEMSSMSNTEDGFERYG